MVLVFPPLSVVLIVFSCPESFLSHYTNLINIWGQQLWKADLCSRKLPGTTNQVLIKGSKILIYCSRLSTGIS